MPHHLSHPHGDDILGKGSGVGSELLPRRTSPSQNQHGIQPRQREHMSRVQLEGEGVLYAKRALEGQGGHCRSR